MKLRTLSRLVIDRRRMEFRYEWPGRTVVRPVEHPHKIDDVAALVEHAGAEVEYAKERKMGSQKLSTQNGIEALLEAVRRGQSDMINGNSLVSLLNQGLIDTEEDGKTYFVVADRAVNGNGHAVNGHSVGVAVPRAEILFGAAPADEWLRESVSTPEHIAAVKHNQLREALRDVRDLAIGALGVNHNERRGEALTQIIRAASDAIEKSL